MNVGDLVWVKTGLCGKQLGILLQPLDWTYEGSIWKVQRLDLLELYGNGCTSMCHPHELEKVNESR
jgi:hypothetical protein